MRRNWGILLVWLAACSVASPNWRITGQAERLATDREGFVTAGDGNADQTMISPADTVSIRLDSVFVRQIQELGKGAELLVYAEIFDRQPDDRERLVRVLFKENNQAAGYLINQNDRLVYGPVQFNGRPIRIRLFVVELDKVENEIAAEMIKTAVQIGSTLAPSFAPFAGTATTVGDLFLQLDQDDRELQYDFTLFPSDSSHGPYLRTGHYVIIKTENRDRGGSGTGSTPDDDSGLVSDESGGAILQKVEDYAAFHTFDADHPLAAEPPITALNLLRVRGSQLWLETAALEYKDDIILAHPSVKADPGFLMADPGGDFLSFERDGMRFRTNQYDVGGEPYTELLVQDIVEPDGDGERSYGPAKRYRIGKRYQYREKTHAIITVTTGGAPVDRSLLLEMSKADEELLSSSLQPAITAERVSENLHALQDSFLELIGNRAALKEVNTLPNLDRQGGAFPRAYLQQLEIPDEGDTLGAAAAAKNRAIIKIVRSIVNGFPHTAAVSKQRAAVTAMRAYTEDHFDPVTGGRFLFDAAGAPPPATE